VLHLTIENENEDIHNYICMNFFYRGLKLYCSIYSKDAMYKTTSGKLLHINGTCIQFIHIDSIFWCFTEFNAPTGGNFNLYCNIRDF
jgi:hypothetical protein